MATEHVAFDGTFYAGVSGVINSADFLMADWRGGANFVSEDTVAEWFGQSRVRKGATLVRRNPSLVIGEMAFKTETLADLYGIAPVEKAGTKDVTAISAGGTEATLTTEPGSHNSFENNDEIVVSDETGWVFEGRIDGAPASPGTTVYVDDGAGGAVANIADCGVMADLDYTDPQYFTRADDVLFDIGNAQDYSLLIRFKRRRQSATEVLMAKTSDYDGTAYGTTAGWVLFIDVLGRLNFAVNDGVDAYLLTGTTPILENEMRFVVVTYDENSAADCKIYLEGYDDTLSRTGTLANIGDCSNALVFSIGAESDGGAPFDGYIVDAAVYDNAVLTAANALAYASAPRVESGAPDAWWPFTDAAANSTCDDEATAANSLDLTLVGGSTANYGVHSRDQIAILSSNQLNFDWGMENAGIGSWTAGDAASEIRKDTQYTKYGARSLRVKNTDATQAFARYTVALFATGMYHFHGWFRAPVTPNGASQLVDVDADASKGITVTQAGATTGGTWYEIEFDFEAGDASATIDLGSGSATDAEMGYWENVHLCRQRVDAGGFETDIAGSDWATTGAPTVDDEDVAEQSGEFCYQINSDDPATKYVSQAVTITSGEEYTFRGHVKAGTADKAVIVLSGAASVTLDNGSETTDWVKVTHRFTAASATLTIKIYGDGVDAWFDNFSCHKVDFREYHFDDNSEPPALQTLLNFTDSNGKTNQIYAGVSKIMIAPILLTNQDYVVHDVEVQYFTDYVYYVEN